MNILRTLPIKELPKELIYKRRVNTVMKPTQVEYVFFSTTGDKNWGEVVLHKKNSSALLKDFIGPSLVVDFIKVNQKGKSLGKTILDFCKNYSKSIGCNGRIVLLADPDYTPEKIPHLFYRKQGFTTHNKKLDRKMDKFIKNGQNATVEDFCTLLMYYPEPAKKTFWEKLVEQFSK